MRVEPYTKNSIIHIVKRGARGMNLVLDQEDRLRFTKSLFLLNEVYMDTNWHRDTAGLSLFERPAHWPERKPLTKVIAWVLMPNHIHLLLQEIGEGGVSKFMQRLGGSMSLCFNLKHGGQGSIFQGAYKGRLVDEDKYLRYLLFYIMVKNVLELYPGGLTAALKNFNDAWIWANAYQFSSLPVYTQNIESPIIDDSNKFFKKMFKETISKKGAYKLLLAYKFSKGDEFKNIMLENW